MKASRLLLLAPLLLAMPGGAQAQREDVLLEHWRISQVFPILCQAITSVDEHLNVNFMIQKANGETALVLDNEQWHFPRYEKHAGAVSFDNWATSQELGFASFEDRGHSVLASPTESTFLSELRTKPHFWVRIPSANVEREIVLPDADQAFAAIDTCLRTP